MQHLETYQKGIEANINQLNLSNNPIELYEPIRYILDLGGKRIRPILCMLATQLFGKPGLSSIHAGIAVELFHNFTLVHDDIMDEAPLRRGYPPVHLKWDERRALLSGDTLFVVAYKELAKHESHLLPDLLSVFSLTAQEVCEGQQMDMDFEEIDDVTINQYIEMIRLKTSVLLGASLEMGAIVAEANIENRKHIYLFGQHIGIAFQLQDDILDVYADGKKFGKQVGGDIISNKKTFLLLKAKELANQEQKNQLNLLAKEQNTTKKVTETMHLFDEIGVKALAKAEMEKHFQLALAYISKIDASQEAKQPLLDLGAYLMNREV